MPRKFVGLLSFINYYTNNDAFSLCAGMNGTNAEGVMSETQVQRPISGFFLALTTVMMWGALPIAVQQVLQGMNVQTIVWYRFLTATLGLLIILGMKKNLPILKGLHRRYWWFLLVGVLGLAGNFYLFSAALQYIPPTTSQILAPMSAFLMLFAGVFLFKEKMLLNQKIGLGFLLVGLGLFFNERWQDFLQFSLYFKGVFLGLCAALVWVTYGVAQKLLLLKFKAQQILLLIYFGCFLVFTPTAEPHLLFNLTGLQLGFLAFCCANTLIGYGCYAEALNRWEVAKVSAVTTQIPIFTMIFSAIFSTLAPDIFQMEKLNLISYLGAGVVVMGALISAIGHKLIKPKA